MLELIRFDLGPEGELNITLGEVSVLVAQTIFDLLADIGAMNEASVNDGMEYTINGQKYRFFEVNDDGTPVNKETEKSNQKTSEGDSSSDQEKIEWGKVLAVIPEKGEEAKKETPSESPVTPQRVLEALKEKPLTMKQLGWFIYNKDIETNGSEYAALYNILMYKIRDEIDIERKEGSRAYTFSLKENAGADSSEESRPSDVSENGDEIDFDRLCSLIQRCISQETEEEMIITYDQLEEARITENATDLWAQLATNDSPLRRRINKRFNKVIRFYDMKHGQESYFIVGVG